MFLKVQQLLTSRGSVKQESVGQLPAIKLLDLLQCLDMKSALQHEAHMYNQMTAIQGVHVPHLLAYGYIQGTGSYSLQNLLKVH